MLELKVAVAITRPFMYFIDVAFLTEIIYFCPFFHDFSFLLFGQNLLRSGIMRIPPTNLPFLRRYFFLLLLMRNMAKIAIRKLATNRSESKDHQRTNKLNQKIRINYNLKSPDCAHYKMLIQTTYIPTFEHVKLNRTRLLS